MYSKDSHLFGDMVLCLLVCFCAWFDEHFLNIIVRSKFLGADWDLVGEICV